MARTPLHADRASRAHAVMASGYDRLRLSPLIAAASAMAITYAEAVRLRGLCVASKAWSKVGPVVARQLEFNRAMRWVLAIPLVVGSPSYIGMQHLAVSPSATIAEYIAAPRIVPSEKSAAPLAISGPRTRVVCVLDGQMVLTEEHSDADTTSAWKDKAVSRAGKGSVCAFTRRTGVASDDLGSPDEEPLALANSGEVKQPVDGDQLTQALAALAAPGQEKLLIEAKIRPIPVPAPRPATAPRLSASPMSVWGSPASAVPSFLGSAPGPMVSWATFDEFGRYDPNRMYFSPTAIDASAPFAPMRAAVDPMPTMASILASPDVVIAPPDLSHRVGWDARGLDAGVADNRVLDEARSRLVTAYAARELRTVASDLDVLADFAHQPRPRPWASAAVPVQWIDAVAHRQPDRIDFDATKPLAYATPVFPQATKDTDIWSRASGTTASIERARFVVPSVISGSGYGIEVAVVSSVRHAVAAAAFEAAKLRAPWLGRYHPTFEKVAGIRRESLSVRVGPFSAAGATAAARELMSLGFDAVMVEQKSVATSSSSMRGRIPAMPTLAPEAMAGQ